MDTDKKPEIRIPEIRRPTSRTPEHGMAKAKVKIGKVVLRTLTRTKARYHFVKAVHERNKNPVTNISPVFNDPDDAPDQANQNRNRFP
jgi:hypothetical protein